MSSKDLSEEPQSERGAKGSRDTGSDTPGGGTTDRPAGTFDQEEVTSTRDHNPAEENIGTTGTRPPEDAEPAVPPYEGRRTSAEGSITSTSAGEGTGADTAGAVHPVTDSKFKAPAPDSTPGGATTSPADEQPASQASETEATDEGVEEGHHSGVRRAEDQPPESRPQ
ncbi:hypothetical protein [Nocardia rhizosphaerihabitans]|uniref:Uncharacterized protein n=1 Tax=Nocardia rhizosphaerihabitans TaxID=1691570 RepID=A0ABQ2K8Q1_9NOCA|nr:hypothetical protein [Nocardia rhizosphaerihabitans]GGN71965.1 hypothetical protein GCM10011610_12810 [Nocardia rhizosphaerihabitans]